MNCIFEVPYEKRERLINEKLALDPNDDARLHCQGCNSWIRGYELLKEERLRSGKLKHCSKQNVDHELV